MKKNILFDNDIVCHKIKLINETKILIGIYSRNEAIQIAQQAGKNLIQITEIMEDNEQYAVCILNDISKYIYETKKTKKSQSSKNDVKEVCMKTNIDLPDMVRKLESTVLFVEEGSPIILTVRKHRRGSENVGEFVKSFLDQQNKLCYKIIKKTERDIRFYLSRKKK